MAAVTGTIVALGGMGVSAAQAIKQNQAMKKADAASQKASQELKAIKEQNAFKQLQVPTLGTQLAQQSQAQRDVQAINMLQGAGAEGVIGGVGQLALAGEQGDLQNAARLDEMKYQRDAMQAQAQQGINASEAERKFYIGMGEKQDAEMRRAQAEANRNAAIEGIFGFAAQGLKSASKLKPLYGKGNGAGEIDMSGAGEVSVNSNLDALTFRTNRFKNELELDPLKIGNYSLDNINKKGSNEYLNQYYGLK